jgi:hypothetical protein
VEEKRYKNKAHLNKEKKRQRAKQFHLAVISLGAFEGERVYGKMLADEKAERDYTE